MAGKKVQNSGTIQIAKDEQKLSNNTSSVSCRQEPQLQPLPQPISLPHFPLLTGSFPPLTFHQPSFYNVSKQIEMSPWMLLQTSPWLEKQNVENSLKQDRPIVLHNIDTQMSPWEVHEKQIQTSPWQRYQLQIPSTSFTTICTYSYHNMNIETSSWNVNHKEIQTSLKMVNMATSFNGTSFSFSGFPMTTNQITQTSPTASDSQMHIRQTENNLIPTSIAASFVPDRVHVSSHYSNQPDGGTYTHISWTKRKHSYTASSYNLKGFLNGDFHVLGSGIFGVVYLATCLDDGRLVAVKLIYHAIEYHSAIVQETKILELLASTGFVPRCYGLCPEAWDNRKQFYGNRTTLRSLISNSVYWQGLSVTIKLNIIY